MSEQAPYVQLQMVWPMAAKPAAPEVEAPGGYRVRTYRPGDEAEFLTVMQRAGFTRWHAAMMGPWVARILPDGWFMAVEPERDTIVATAMCLHDASDLHPFGGELGWVACDPDHTGRGLGRAVCAAATARFIGAGYHNIHLYTEHWRVAALKTYLKLGYLPFLFTPEMAERWRAVCAELGWPYTPEVWPTG
jgi:mycothiol synthase